MSKYNRVSQNETDSDDTLQANDKHCDACGSYQNNSWPWTKSLKRERTLNTYMFFAILVLLIANLSLSANTFISSRDSKPEVHHHDHADEVPSGSRYKSAEAAAFFSHHEHGDGGEEHVHGEITGPAASTKPKAPAKECPSAVAQAEPSTEDIVKRVSSYTPAIEAIEYYDLDLEYDYEGNNPYRGRPTDELEKTWMDLVYHQGFLVPSAAMSSLNRTNLDKYQKADADKGDGYLAWSEMHRQLGCLNMLRQYTWFIEGAYTPDKVPPEMRVPPKELRERMNHCVEAMRMNIMCAGDMTPSLVLKERNPAGWRNDFGGHHKCRNFTKLQEWTLEHGAENWGEEQGHHEKLNATWNLPPF